MQLKIFKSYSPQSFHPISATLYEDIGYHGRIQILKVLWHFEILIWKSMGKIIKV